MEEAEAAMRVFAVVAFLLMLPIAACSDGEADTVPSETRPSTTPGAPWVSYTPHSGPVGTVVHIDGNVGQAALDTAGGPASRVVGVTFWRLDDPSGKSYALALGQFPYDSSGSFSGVVVIPPELGPHQEPADTPNFQVVPGDYAFRFHPVDAGLPPFSVTSE
jgi:hypothetical protein